MNKPETSPALAPVSLLDEQEAAHRYVESVAHTADNPDEYGPMWHGWALREAFLKGIEWERSRSSNQPDMNISPLVLKVLEAEQNMDAAERLEFWSLLMQPYCRNCGEKDPQGRCQCENED